MSINPRSDQMKQALVYGITLIIIWFFGGGIAFASITLYGRPGEIVSLDIKYETPCNEITFIGTALDESTAVITSPTTVNSSPSNSTLKYLTIIKYSYEIPREIKIKEIWDTLQGRDSCSTSATLDILITVEILEEITGFTVLNGKESYDLGDSIQFSLDPAEGGVLPYEYMWEVSRDGESWNWFGKTTTPTSPTYGFDQEGVYNFRVTVRDANQQAQSSSILSFEINFRPQGGHLERLQSPGSVGPNQTVVLSVKYTDKGRPYPDILVDWALTQTNGQSLPNTATGRLRATQTRTNAHGIAITEFETGDKPFNYQITATVDTLSGPITVSFTVATIESVDIVLTLEEPTDGSVYSGISNVRGWAVSPRGLTKIELYIDGTLSGYIPLGGKRSDVGANYPDYPRSADSGFAMAFNYANLMPGSHIFKVRAVDTNGGAQDMNVNVTVTHFANSYIADPFAVNLDQATLTSSGNTIHIRNLLAEGQSYEVRLDWRPAIQGFAITQISPMSSTVSGMHTEKLPRLFLNSSSAYSPFSDGVVTTPQLITFTTAANDGIVLKLEEPVGGNTYSGIANVRGWAVAPQGVQRVELYIDDVLKGNIPLGGKRSDVRAAYPNYPDSVDSGFAMAINYSELMPVIQHTFTVRAIDNAGSFQDASAIINTTRFDSSYIADPAAVNLNQADLTGEGNTIKVENLVANSKRYNVQMNWQTAAQGFALTQITSQECTASLSPSSARFPATGGGLGSLHITIPNDCSWTAQSDVFWITIFQETTNGTGSGNVNYTVSENLGVARTGTLSVAGQSLIVSQEAKNDDGSGR